MKKIKTAAQRFLLGAVLFSVPANLLAWEPNAGDLKQAVNTGNFASYFDNLSKWLSQKATATPGGTSELALKTLLKDPAVVSALGQRTFLLKYGSGNVENFAKAELSNQAFLLWLMQNGQTLDQLLIGAVPIGLRQREDNSFGIPGGSLNIWKTIYDADPESRTGLYLKLAMATAMNPPGTGCRGAGQAEKPEEPLSRYQHFKAAHKNKELFPSFDRLEVWELRHVTCSMATNADLAWGREMVNTWNPTFRNNEGVVETTTQVWRRNSPISHGNSYKNVLAGGGKCGPRSSWSVFICQAFGIPATGVGQPAHACVAYRKPDGVWATAFGRSWAASKLLGLSGNEFVEGMNARLQPERFARVEHMRWLALALPAASQGPILELAKEITKAPPEPAATPAKVPAPVAAKPATSTLPVVPPTFSAVNGVIHADAASFFDNGGCTVFGGHPGVWLNDSYPAGTGKQIHFAANMGSVWAGYKINVPATGIYQLVAKVGTVNFEQGLFVRSYGAMYTAKSATASAVYKNMVKDLGPQQAIDNNPGTRWAVNEGVDQAMLEIDLGEVKPISTCMIDERFFNRISRFKVEYKAGSEWKPLFEDTNIGLAYTKDFPMVKAQNVRLSTLDGRERGGPTIWEFSVGTVKNGYAWINLPCTYGMWETTKPVEIRLVKGAQTIWFFAPFQRGVSMKSFDLRFKGASQAASTPVPAAPKPSIPSSQLKNATGEDAE
ncbi:MAG: discoidin domain-containing protein [Verrucomicrobiota bacterium]